ncbi:unnamed protein product [Cylicocyclus nassatus]|uniref:C-type lectin domain-containing protein n=1 Tax=Cylicocyclus nassatus TaxID=53992 RepID=A0AA36DUN0_CYLNA|nr:unnamed protein product [Cylicocyclus nassatus]
MYSVKLLLVVLIPSLNAFVELNRTTQLLRGPEKYHGLSHLSVSHAACPARCESGWTLFDKTEACYKTFFGETFYTAEYICSTYGGHLTSIHSSEENNFVAGKNTMDYEMNSITKIGPGLTAQKLISSFGARRVQLVDLETVRSCSLIPSSRTLTGFRTIHGRIALATQDGERGPLGLGPPKEPLPIFRWGLFRTSGSLGDYSPMND